LRLDAVLLERTPLVLLAREPAAPLLPARAGVVPLALTAAFDDPATPCARLRWAPSEAGRVNVLPHSGQTNVPDFSLVAGRLRGLVEAERLRGLIETSFR
jgi:hypothetical protein